MSDLQRRMVAVLRREAPTGHLPTYYGEQCDALPQGPYPFAGPPASGRCVRYVTQATWGDGSYPLRAECYGAMRRGRCRKQPPRRRTR